MLSQNCGVNPIETALCFVCVSSICIARVYSIKTGQELTGKKRWNADNAIQACRLERAHGPAPAY